MSQGKILSIKSSFLSSKNKVFSLFISYHEHLLQHKVTNTIRQTHQHCHKITGWGIQNGNKELNNRIGKELNWPLDLAGCFPNRHLSLVSSIQEGSSDGQHGVPRRWPECREDFMNHRVLDTKTTSVYHLMHFYVCVFLPLQHVRQIDSCKIKHIFKSAIKTKVKCHSYHKSEALHLGYVVATGDLHCVSWWGEVPAEHWGTLDLSPSKHPPPTTHRPRHYSAGHPAFNLIQWWSTAMQWRTKRPSSSGFVCPVFIFFSHNL